MGHSGRMLLLLPRPLSVGRSAAYFGGTRSFLDVTKLAARTRKRCARTLGDTSEFPPKGFNVARIRKWRRAGASSHGEQPSHAAVAVAVTFPGKRARLASLIFQSSCGHYREFAFHLE